MKEKIGAISGFILTLLIIAFALIVGQAPKSNENDRFFDKGKTTAYFYAEQSVKEALNDPDTAKFEGYETAVVEKLSRNQYCVFMRFRAKNGFGAYVRNVARCTVDSSGSVSNLSISDHDRFFDEGELGAYDAAEQAVRGMLKHPETAIFIGCQDAIIENLQGNRYHVIMRYGAKGDSGTYIKDVVSCMVDSEGRVSDLTISDY